MSAMSEMSKAMRHVIEDHSTGGTLQTVSDGALGEFVAIVGAFYADLHGELGRRSFTTDDRTAVVSAALEPL